MHNDCYCLQLDDLKKVKEDFIIMHPLPRVNEIATSVDQHPAARYFEQVKLGNIEKFLNSPQRAPWLRLDEVHAGRSLNLRWTSLD